MITVYQSNDGCFQQDSWPCCKAQITSNWFPKHDRALSVLKCPQQSPNVHYLHFTQHFTWTRTNLDFQNQIAFDWNRSPREVDDDNIFFGRFLNSFVVIWVTGIRRFLRYRFEGKLWSDSWALFSWHVAADALKLIYFQLINNRQTTNLFLMSFSRVNSFLN